MSPLPSPVWKGPSGTPSGDFPAPPHWGRIGRARNASWSIRHPRRGWPDALLNADLNSLRFCRAEGGSAMWHLLALPFVLFGFLVSGAMAAAGVTLVAIFTIP